LKLTPAKSTLLLSANQNTILARSSWAKRREASVASNSARLTIIDPVDAAAHIASLDKRVIPVAGGGKRSITVLAGSTQPSEPSRGLVKTISRKDIFDPITRQALSPHSPLRCEFGRGRVRQKAAWSQAHPAGTVESWIFGVKRNHEIFSGLKVLISVWAQAITKIFSTSNTANVAVIADEVQGRAGVPLLNRSRITRAIL